jgi:hypothetical protein
MGTRIHVLLTHDLQCEDTAAVAARLAPVVPALIAVRDYWRSVGSGADNRNCWELQPANSREPHMRSYEGPGSIWLRLTSRAACIYTGGRWRGFLSIEPLRRVHLAAFRAIATALHSPTLAISHDSCGSVEDTFLANGTQQECIAMLLAAFGEPSSSVDAIGPEVAQQAEHGVPNLWYLDSYPAGC